MDTSACRTKPDVSRTARWSALRARYIPSLCWSQRREASPHEPEHAESRNMRRRSVYATGWTYAGRASAQGRTQGIVLPQARPYDRSPTRLMYARDRAGTHPRTCTDEQFGRPARASGNDHPERTRARWQKARSQTARARVPADEVVSGIDARRAHPGILGDAASQRAAGAAEIGRWVAYWACVILFGSNRLAMTLLCRTTRHSAIERERACGTCYCGLAGTSFASAAR